MMLCQSICCCQHEVRGWYSMHWARLQGVYITWQIVIPNLNCQVNLLPMVVRLNGIIILLHSKHDFFVVRIMLNYTRGQPCWKIEFFVCFPYTWISAEISLCLTSFSKCWLKQIWYKSSTSANLMELESLHWVAISFSRISRLYLFTHDFNLPHRCQCWLFVAWHHFIMS